jgi:hypothetical protein
VNSIRLTQVSGLWRSFVNMIIQLHVPNKRRISSLPERLLFLGALLYDLSYLLGSNYIAYMLDIYIIVTS